MATSKKQDVPLEKIIEEVRALEKAEAKPPVEQPAPVAPEPEVHHTPEPTTREELVNYKFNEVISYLNALRDSYHDAEVLRMYSIAITEVQTAHMWALKALNWRG
jgi:hypothetical protein